ncbi:MAG: hypothetical protein JNL82_04440 [Myxococcales bacterium]|nr:hypothetical protein [Myxococcales bacterium]
MTEIPRAVLSEHYQERMRGRKLVSAIFTTFRLEPSFFETEVLPVFLDIPLSHDGKIKLVQLEDALRSIDGTIALYYDQNGIVDGSGGMKLDVRRYPIQHSTGIFHPKNVLVLVEDTEADGQKPPARALLCSCSSANLTRAGWWENVEVAHVEEIQAGERTPLRDALLEFVDRLVRAAEGRRPNDELRAAHGAASDIRAFLRDTTQLDRRVVDGRLSTHFHGGEASLPDFLAGTAGKLLHGLCLEVVSPYFDGGGESAPLAALVDRFEPRDVRVFLPRNDRGEALCSEALFEWMCARGASWGALPGELLRLGKAEAIKQRVVHAKVYRFFEPKRGGREFLYVGSANLTTAALRVAGRGGNWETGFLVEATTGARPDWWLGVESRRPPGFAPREEDEGTTTSGGTRLVLRYRWDTREAIALWGGDGPSPALLVRHGGVTVLALADLPARVWSPLGAEHSARLEQTLLSTSVLEVVGERPEPGLLLVQEEGMARRPSLLFDLSAADILRYWALLTVEQRAAFLEARAAVGDDDPLLTKWTPLRTESTLFDRFAGIFHAFACLEEHVRAALAAGKEREAEYRLFGKKYDSLGTLIDRVLADITGGGGDRVEQYVVLLCARQLLRELGRTFPDYWDLRREDVRTLELRIGEGSSVRDELARGDADMPGFLDWFDRWFLKRAAAVQTEDAEP